jgi:fibronectin type III domain protein
VPFSQPVTRDFDVGMQDMLSVHNPNAQNLESWVGRCSGALLILTIAGLMVACGDSVSVSVKGGTAILNGGEAILAWDPPVSVSGLAGYRVYYGTTSGTYLQLPGEGVPVTNATTYTVTGLQGATTYYFAVTAYDTSNSESGFSNEVFKTIP